MSKNHSVGSPADHSARAYLSGGHIVSAGLFGCLAIAGLFVLALLGQNNFAGHAALISAASAYLSQLFAANVMWSDAAIIHTLTWVFIAAAIVSWSIGAVSLFL